jgi:hypothetical protein
MSTARSKVRKIVDTTNSAAAYRGGSFMRFMEETSTSEQINHSFLAGSLYNRQGTRPGP